MTPRSDPPTHEGQAETFTLANMIPQNSDNNQHLWEGIESAVRTLAKRSGELYVITGPLFRGENLKQLNGRVVAPTQIFRVVYNPKKRTGAAYLVENEATSDYKVVSIAELERIASINFLPGLSESAKASPIHLPKPTPHGERTGAAERGDKSEATGQSAKQDILRQMRGLSRTHL
jgi:endonuclease G